jgi:hypothetical protein
MSSSSPPCAATASLLPMCAAPSRPHRWSAHGHEGATAACEAGRGRVWEGELGGGVEWEVEAGGAAEGAEETCGGGRVWDGTRGIGEARRTSGGGWGGRTIGEGRGVRGGREIEEGCGGRQRARAEAARGGGCDGGGGGGVTRAQMRLRRVQRTGAEEEVEAAKGGEGREAQGPPSRHVG